MIAPKIEQTVILLPGHRLFQPIGDLVVILAGFGHAAAGLANLSAQRGGSFTAETRYYGRAVMLPMDGPFELALEGRSPERIEVGFGPFKLPERSPNLSTTGLNGVMRHILKPAFLGFFERYNVWLNDKVGEATNWPMTLNFARVVRNAAAHGGITIRSKAAAPVSWRGLSYSHADNGSEVIGPDLQTGDIVGLMFDVCDDLDALRAPVL